MSEIYRPERPDGAATIATESFLRTLQTVEDVARRRMIGVVYGDSGLGKTFAVTTALARLEGAVGCHVAFSHRPTARQVLQELYHALTGVEAKGDRIRIQHDLRSVLAEEPRLIVIDEAQYLTRTAIEEVRFLHDRRTTDFGLILCGGQGCMDTLTKFKMLESRTHRWVKFEPVIDVLEVMPRYHALFAQSPPEVLIEIDERYAHGVWRRWETFLADAIESAAETGLATVDDWLMRDVFERARGGRAAA